MAPSLEIQKRIDDLNRECEKDARKYLRLGRWNQFIDLLLMVLAIGASVGAAVGGLFFGLSGKITGAIAALPSLVAFAATTLRLQNKANWHYRMSDAVTSLRRRLTQQLPESPSAENVSGVSAARNKLDTEMSEQWERECMPSWVSIGKKKL
jgi:hypothetical protein